MSIYDYLVFEECVADAFKLSGYSVDIDIRKKDIDFIATKDGTPYFVEVKFTQASKQAALQINSRAEVDGAIPILVSAYKLSDTKRAVYAKEFPNLVVIDIANLLYAVQDDSELRNKLISVLPYSVEEIEHEPGLLQPNILTHSDYTESLISEMDLCIPGRPMAHRYEKVCCRLLKNIFSEDLALWKPQQKSNNDLYKFDLLCRIKDGNQKTFWSILERFFNSKYVVFEFKNYADAVTQKEIYTTEKYLYAKALRSVAIIIAANGYEDNAHWAAKGSLRENGKLIILLDTNDLIAMNKMKITQDDPADYLMSKLDDLLLELEK